MKKNFLSILLTVTVLTLSLLPTAVFGTDKILIEKPILSELTVEEQLVFLRSNGVEIDQHYENFTINTVAKLELDPNYLPVVNNPELWKITDELKNVLKNYYGDYVVAENISVLSASAYTLQDSTVIGTWNDSYVNYNCYSYALYKKDAFHLPGDFSGTEFNLNDPMTTIMARVKADLKSSELSKECVCITTVRPTSLNENQYVICARKGTEDIHFMRSTTGSTWRHKPSWTNPLKYKYTDPSTTVWTNEHSYENEEYAGNTYYDSEIYYAVYQSEHGTTTYMKTGNNYHSGSRHFYEWGYKCADCGEFSNTVWKSSTCSGPPCAGTVSLIDFE